MDDCIGRTPYVSLIGFVLAFTGSGLMGGTNYEALRRTNIVFEDNFYSIRGPQTLQLVGLVCCLMTMLFSVINVTAGACATGSTRQHVYAHKKSQTTGKNYSRVLLILTYFVTSVWLILFVAFAVPVGLWAMLHTVCREETDYWRGISLDKDETSFTYTFNLTNYGLYRRPLDTSLYSESVNSPSAFTHLCQQVSTVGPLFTISLFSSFLVLVGLNCFVACLSSASVRLDLSSEIEQMRRFPRMSKDLGASDDYPLHPLLSQHHFLPTAGVDTQQNTFAYPETSSNVVPSSILSDGTFRSHHHPNFLRAPPGRN